MPIRMLAVTVKSWGSLMVRRKSSAAYFLLTCVLVVFIYHQSPFRIQRIQRHDGNEYEGHRGRGHRKEPGVVREVKLRVQREVEARVQAPVHVPRGLSDLESMYYYDDGRPRKRTHRQKSEGGDGRDSHRDEPQYNAHNFDPDEGHKVPAAAPAQNPEIRERGPAAPPHVVPAVAQENRVKDKPSGCDLSRLSVDDTDVKTLLDPCELPLGFGDPELEEKVNKVEKIDLPLLSNYRNPCWYERLPEKDQYINRVHMFWWQVKESFDRILPVMNSRRKKSHMWHLRCLPLVYIIGLQYCGAMDMFNVLLEHPYVVKGATREPFYWDRNRWYYKSNVSNYLNLYDEAAEKIRMVYLPKTLGGRNVTYHPMVTIDGSIHYLTDFYGLRKLPANQDKDDAPHLVPHLIRNLTPRTNLVIVVLLRNPTDLVFLNYASFDTGDDVAKSPEEFHELASEQLERLTRCAKRYSLRHCLYKPEVTRNKRKVAVHAGVYLGFIRDWIGVFPKMKIYVWEEFQSNRADAYTDVIKTIGLYPEPRSVPQKQATETDPDPGFQMLEKTRTMLDDFYRPYNSKLAQFLKNDKFLFKTKQ